MKKIERLYGVKTAFWNCMNYQHALIVKNECAINVIKSIHAKKFVDVTNDDTYRMNECLRAIRFNEELLSE